MDIQEYKDMFDKRVGEWREENADVLSDFLPDAINALADLAVISAIPASAITMKLNILKMKRSGDLLRYAADQKDTIQKLQTSIKHAVADFLKDAGILVLKGLLA